MESHGTGESEMRDITCNHFSSMVQGRLIGSQTGAERGMKDCASKQQRLEYNDDAEVSVSSPAFFICLHHNLCLHDKNVNNSDERYASPTYY
ncbi:hypothetical protein IGI04_031409 [Brassica rapa subsp. trilocularis]|uniref:Uncharacterized protein n=1 Tax=Brassica rapa subsp. trilocularis TaxID=1813537 RepID=A0ABQ7LTH4_BRACM|nr:hypothetical protein IGI04_031409 [Brassica rapa subsp. trilocularis]